MFPHIASAHQIQRNYRMLFDEVIEKQEPLFILNKNKPEIVIIAINQFENLQKKAEAYETAMAKKALEIYEKEEREGKLKKLRSLGNL